MSCIDISLSNTRLKLAEEEKAQIEAGNTPNYEVGAVGMVMLGLDIEKLQYVYLLRLFIIYINYLSDKALEQKFPDAVSRLFSSVHHWLKGAIHA